MLYFSISVFLYFCIFIFCTSLFLYLYIGTCCLCCSLLRNGRDFSFFIFLHLRISVFRHFCISVFSVFKFVFRYLLPLVQPVAHWERLRIIRSPAFMCPLSSQLLQPDNSNSVDWSILIFVFVFLYFGIYIWIFVFWYFYLSSLLPAASTRQLK